MKPHTLCDSVATQSDGRQAAICNGLAEDGPFERSSLLDTLAAKGVRLTAQRRALLEIVQSARGQLDANSLLALARAKERSVDRATVYRTLSLLKRHGLIDELDLLPVDGEARVGGAKTRLEHAHLACYECGHVEEMVSVLFQQLKRDLARQAGFEIRDSRLEMGGICRKCNEKNVGFGSYQEAGA